MLPECEGSPELSGTLQSSPKLSRAPRNTPEIPPAHACPCDQAANSSDPVSSPDTAKHRTQ
eukprot:4745084-Alexandrium_andersonii.AAC.1